MNELTPPLGWVTVGSSVPRLTDEEVEQARKVIASQAATIPPAGVGGIRNIGVAGALDRAREGLRDVNNRPVGDAIAEPTGFPSLTEVASVFEFPSPHAQPKKARFGRGG